MVTQSGGFGFGVVAIAAHFGVGCNYAISTGNEADLTLLDWIADLIERDDVEIVVAFMEGITDGRRLIEIGERALELGKPVLAWKVGNTDIGSQAATSHSARLTAGYELYRAAFRRGGLVEIRDVDDLVDIAKAFHIAQAAGRQRRGRADALRRRRRAARRPLRRKRPARCRSSPKRRPPSCARRWSRSRPVANPVDATANGYNDAFASYGKAVGAGAERSEHRPGDRAHAARQVGARLVARTCVAPAARIEKAAASSTGPPRPTTTATCSTYLEENGVPCILGAGRAAHALAALTEFAGKKRAFRARARQDAAARPRAARRSSCPPAPPRSASTAPSSCCSATACRSSRGSAAAAGGNRGAAGVAPPLPGRRQDRVRRTSRTRPRRAGEAGHRAISRRLKQAAREIVAAAQALQAGRAHRRRAGAGNGHGARSHRRRGERPRPSARSWPSAWAASSPS